MVVGTSFADDTAHVGEQDKGVFHPLPKPVANGANDSDDLMTAQANEESSPESFRSPDDVLKLTKRLVSLLNDTQKLSLLQDLLVSIPLPHCVSLQVAELLHRSCPPNCGDFVRWLPPETSLRIFSFLDPVSLSRCAQVNKCWYRLTQDPSLWRRLCGLPPWQFSKEFEALQFQRCARLPQKGRIPSDLEPQLQLHAPSNPSQQSHVPEVPAVPRAREPDLDWRAMFTERFRLRRNWLNSRCHVRTFHTNQTMEMQHGGVTCVDFDERRIVVGSCNHGNIQIWKRNTNATWSAQKVVCHSGAVRCLQLRGNHLVTGSSDNTIKLWRLSQEDDWSGMVCLQTFLGHTNLVRCIQMNDDIVVSGSYDHTLKLWSLETGACKKTFKGHTGEIWSLQFDEEKIVSGSGDTTIRVWNFDGSCTNVLWGHDKGVACIAFDGFRLVSGSHDCTIRFWDLKSATCQRIVDWKAGEGHKDVVRCVVTDGRRVLSASDDKAIKEWDLVTGQRLQTLCGHEDGVTCLQFNDQVIVSGSFDQSVRLWDFSVC